MPRISDEKKQEFITEWNEKIDEADEKTVAKYKKYVAEGIEKDWICALEAMAYGSYGGNAAFEDNFYVAKDCLLKLTAMSENPFYHNSLGFIYYYGRCNEGKPEYEKAFIHFSVAAAAGVFEAKYKLSDMFLNGYYVPRNYNSAFCLVDEIFGELKERFADGDFRCPFADVALRVANMYENGYGTEANIEAAYFFGLYAKLAIEQRISKYTEYGDEEVLKKIYETIERIEKELPEDYFATDYTTAVPYMIGEIIKVSDMCDVTIHKLKGKTYIDASGFWADESAKKYAIIVIPHSKYIQLKTNIRLEVVGLMGIDAPKGKLVVDGLQYDDEEGRWVLTFRGRYVFSIACESFRYVVD